MKELKEFDMQRKPHRTLWILYILMAFGSLIPLPLMNHHLKKINCKGLKPPYIVLASHAAFIDFTAAIQASFPHRLNWVISIEEYNRGEWLMRGVGGIAKRKFTSDFGMVKHILYCIKKKSVVYIYPEARYNLAGKNEPIDKALGKLVKLAKCPVVIMINHGHFIHEPQWDKKHYRNLRMESTFTQIVTREEVETLSADEIQKRIEENFVYNDYEYQLKNKIPCKFKNRLNNAHKVLYKCPHCKTEFQMFGFKDKLTCKACGNTYHMDIYGVLHNEDEEKTMFTSMPDWYEWERQEVIKEIHEGKYHFEEEVDLEKLYEPKTGFVRLGKVNFVHDLEGMHLDGTLDNKEEFHFFRPALEQSSCHIEYFFKDVDGLERSAIDVASVQHTYFIYLTKEVEALTKIHFATEEIYKLALERNNKQ